MRQPLPTADVQVRAYARLGVAYYVMYDPAQQLSDQVVRVYALHPGNSAALQSKRKNR